MSANLSAILYLISGVLFILALRGLSSPETSETRKFIWNYWNGDSSHGYVFVYWKFFILDLFMLLFF